VGHWIWGGGWLAELGMWDFAGSSVVHSTGGWLALTGAIMLGPRTGKYNPDGSSNAFPGHNIPLAALGTFILWFGWFGFNPGSTMALVPDIAHIAATTNMAGASGGIAAMILAWWMFKKPDVSMALNGVLGGLVGITASCAFVSIGSAIWIGIFAGILVVLSVIFIDQVLHVDDPVGAIRWVLLPCTPSAEYGERSPSDFSLRTSSRLVQPVTGFFSAADGSFWVPNL
jgi:Amt family ammonium transporter